ncbi:MAG TPA: hypothetical protein VH088_07025 [Terriglobales bacterium]|jgi:hypothetical protein|nr:hypothetical protein [Terriglobales bacterium]
MFVDTVFTIENLGVFGLMAMPMFDAAGVLATDKKKYTSQTANRLEERTWVEAN